MKLDSNAKKLLDCNKRTRGNTMPVYTKARNIARIAIENRRDLKQLTQSFELTLSTGIV